MKIHDFENAETWTAHLSSVLSKGFSLHEWVRELSGGLEPLDTLLEAWGWFHNRFAEIIDSEQMLPSPEEFEDFDNLTSIISAWCESDTRFDSSPFILHAEGLQQMWDRSESGMTAEIPESQWNHWCQTGWDALLLIKRIRLHLEGKFPNNANAGQSNPSKIQFNNAFDGIKDSWKEVLALGLLFYSDGKMKQSEIASAVGYSHQSGLRRLPKFSQWFNNRSELQTFVSYLSEKKAGRSIEKR